MYFPSEKEFIRIAKHGNVIPVYKEILADLETPVSAFMKIGMEGYSYLLESVEGAEKIARFSFIGIEPSLIFKSKGREISILKLKEKKTFVSNFGPLEEIKKIMKAFRLNKTEGLPRFCGGLVGFLGYDLVRFFEELPDKNPELLRFPDTMLILTDSLIIFDHSTHKMKIVVNANLDEKLEAGSWKLEAGNKRIRRELSKIYEKTIDKIDIIIKKLERPLPKAEIKHREKTKLKITSNFRKEGFVKKVLQAKKYIKRGDIIQVVLSQRFKTEIGTEPFLIYRALRSINPSPYMYYLNFKDIKLIGSSPELLVRCEESRVETRPIAGTRQRGRDDKEDKALEKELLADTKERAEHVMLVDLGRNDIGRVCKMGSVRVSEFMTVERFSHVMHIVSNCEGLLEDGRDCFDTFRATFPAGTVTGAPKIRAMEIIDELENIRRGPYAGAVGYFSFSGNMDTCINIRTIIIKGDVAFIQAGAGIVADSEPEREYLETVNKAKALFRAIEMAEQGLE